MQVTYRPPQGSIAPITLYGYRFTPDIPVPVTEAKALRKFEGNRYFEVTADGVKMPSPATPPQTVQEEPADLPSVPDSAVKALMTIEQTAKVAENGAKAAAEGKPRAVPVAYRKYEGGAEAWLAAYDNHKPE